VKKSQYATNKMSTQRTNPSIPLPSMVRHACIPAIIAAAVASGFHVERCLTRGSFFEFSFIASHFLTNLRTTRCRIATIAAQHQKNLLNNL
jgi:hypothetical protein